MALLVDGDPRTLDRLAAALGEQGLSVTVLDARLPTGAGSELMQALRLSGLELDETARLVRRDDREIELTGTEGRLLRALMRRPDHVLTRLQLLHEVWDYDFGGDARVLERYISNLRRKLGEPAVIRTIRGVGYALRPPR